MELILGPILGAVSHNKAKVWIFWNQINADQALPQCHLFKDENCTEEISRVPFKTISSSVYESGSVKGIACLAELSFPSRLEKYYFKIRPGADNHTRDEKSYAIDPFPRVNENIESLSFAIISCSRPLFRLRKDNKNFTPMWRYLGEEMKKHDSRFLIQAGDQVYADEDHYDEEHYNAYRLSLEEDSDEKRLWHYRHVYRKSWQFLEVQNVMQTFPQYMIWDDHEIANGWGSNSEHTQDPKFRAVFKAARQAYLEFQQSHNPDPLRRGELYYGFHYGPVAFLVMDIRGHRDYGFYLDNKDKDDIYPLAGKHQWDDISDWLNSNRLKRSKILFVVTSVPVIHLSRSFAALGFLKNDIRDQWSTQHNKNERRILLSALYEWMGVNNRPAFILGGDVHIGTVAEIREKQTSKVIHQITSSPISHDPPFFLDFFIAPFSSHFDFHLDKEKKRPVHGYIRKRYRRKNFAIVNVEFEGQIPHVTLEMFESKRKEPDIMKFF